MKVSLGKFARFGIESRLGMNVASGIQAALLHYTRRVRSGWEPVVPPRFCGTDSGRDRAATLELTVEPEILAVLEAEANLYRVSLDRILAHAVFVYLADLDSDPAPGRVGGPTLN